MFWNVIRFQRRSLLGGVKAKTYVNMFVKLGSKRQRREKDIQLMASYSYDYACFGLTSL